MEPGPSHPARAVLKSLLPRIPATIAPRLKREVEAYIEGAFPFHRDISYGAELLDDTLELLNTLAPSGYEFDYRNSRWDYWPITLTQQGRFDG